VISLLAFDEVSKRYGPSWRGAPVLDRVSFEVGRGESVGIVGDPRAGKSTLLRLAAGIETPDSGVVRFRGRNLSELSERERSRLLGRAIGFVPGVREQLRAGALRSERVLDYVGAPLVSQGRSHREATASARRALGRIDAEALAQLVTAELSAAELTLVALARALVRRPSLLLVDDPAVAVSPRQRDRIRDLLWSLDDSGELAVLVASDDLGVLRGCRRMLSIGRGQIVTSEREGVLIPLPKRLVAGEG
jgi:putative ABC transport system ATP-binding protein